MTVSTRLALLVLGALAVGAWLLSAYSPVSRLKAPPATPADAVWRSGYPVGHVHLAPPDTILGGPMCGPHPLYARPPRCGHNRTGLIDYGWDWIISPPSDWDFGNQGQ